MKIGNEKREEEREWEIPSAFSRTFVVHKTEHHNIPPPPPPLSFLPIPLLPHSLVGSFFLSFLYMAVSMCACRANHSHIATRCPIFGDGSVEVEVFIPHVFQQVTFGLVFKVQSCHLLCVRVFQLLRHFDLEETKREFQ